jgi:hypothetical protein
MVEDDGKGVGGVIENDVTSDSVRQAYKKPRATSFEQEEL